MKLWDGIVIGGGPAGATAATFLARQGHRVLLLEKTRFPRHKLCGEFLTPECQPIFARLGVQNAMAEAGALSISKMTLYAPDGRGLEVPMRWIANGHDQAIGLTRARLDAVLLDAAREAGVEVREGFHVSPRVRREGAAYVIEGKADADTVETFHAKLIVDASGRNGVFSGLRPEGSDEDAEANLARLNGSRLFGCKTHLRGVQGLNGSGELYFYQSGYGGMTEVEGDRVNLCFLTTAAVLREARGDRQRLLDLTIRSNPRGRARLRGSEIDGAWLGTGPMQYGKKKAPEGVLAIGDAGAFIDPFTGSGILLALTSGELAAKVVHECFAEGVESAPAILRRYEAAHRAIVGTRLRVTSVLRSLAFHPAARNVMVSVLSHAPSLMKLIARGTRQRLTAHS